MVATGKSVWLNFLGSEIKFVQGQKYRSRIAEAGRNNSETLILLHGGGGHLESFAFNVVPLSETFHVIAVEMLWHGLSDGPPIEEDRNAQTADQVLDIMDTMGLDRVWLHGEAAGASVVTSFALRRPERLKGAIFESGAGVRFKEATTRPPLPPVGGIPMGERTLQLLKNPTWQGVKDRLLMVMHFNLTPSGLPQPPVQGKAPRRPAALLPISRLGRSCSFRGLRDRPTSYTSPQ
jgi:pimeloyl-ACP methyl ester carboxylesterase